MSKVLCIKDVRVNYDLAIPLRKNYMSEELEKIGFTALEKLLEKYDNKDVAYVLLTGEVLLEETIMVEEMDRFINLLSSYEALKFIVAPSQVVTEDSWYSIVNWPENCRLLVPGEESYIDQDSNMRFSIEATSDEGDTEWSVTMDEGCDVNKDLDSFFPKTYTTVREKSVALYDYESKEVVYDKNVWLLLKKIDVTINPEMDIETIYNLINQNIDRSLDGQCFYQCELQGKVSKEFEKDLVNLIREKFNNEVECLFINNTYKNYNIDEIKNNNKDNLIGLFIENVMNSDKENDEVQRIVETGLDYLL